MDWLHSYGSLRAHPKTKKLARLLGVGVPQTIGHLHCLWWWSMDYAPDGDLTDIEPDVIADGAAWEGDPQVFLDGLINATKEKGGHGFLESGDRLVIHDHEEYIGRYLSKAAKDAARKRQERAERAAAKAQTSDTRPTDGDATSDARPMDVPRTSDGHPADGARCPSRYAHARTEETEEKEETEPSPTPPLGVEKRPDGASAVENPGEEQAPQEDEPLEALRHLPTCEGDACDVRALHVGMRSTIAEIVGPENAGKLYNPTHPINRALAGMAGYICTACSRVSAGPGVTQADREPLCRRALREYLEEVLAFHRKNPIRSLPAFLRTRYANMTEAPVSDALYAELRALERKGANGKGGSQRVGGLLPVLPSEAQPRRAAKTRDSGEGAA